MEFVFATSVYQVFPLSLDLSIRYPVIADPPSLLGAFQLRFIFKSAPVAVNPVGGCGGPIGVALTSFDGIDSPAELTDVTV